MTDDIQEFPNNGDKPVDRLSHACWLSNEYSQWIKALQESTVNNFKEHPMVQRMLSEDLPVNQFRDVMHLQHLLLPIDNIGRETMKPVSGACLRMAHYALKVLECNPTSIVEIGGGVGQFYVILRALGYEGQYNILDLPEVRHFQNQYLFEAEKRTGLNLPLTNCDMPGYIKPDFLVSFYAYGEFDDETKAQYLPLIKSVPHGLMLYNPHSGASTDIPFECTVTDEYPKTGENNKMLVW